MENVPTRNMGPDPSLIQRPWRGVGSGSGTREPSARDCGHKCAEAIQAHIPVAPYTTDSVGG